MTRVPTLELERRLWRRGVRCIAGIDEAGRGALAGPVVAAAVIFLPGRLHSGLRGVRDSKQLAPARRLALYEEITARSLAWAIGVVSHRLIDRLNIARAAWLAMRRAVGNLCTVPEHLLIDGRLTRRQRHSLHLPYRDIVGGDSRVFSIAAASIVAKVTRDRLMERLDRKFPSYGFCRHKGYGTAAHYQALAAHGPCLVHRRSFALV